MNKWRFLVVVVTMGGLFGAVLLLVLELLEPNQVRYPLRNLSGAEAADILMDHIPRTAVDGWSDNMVWVRGSKHEQEVAAQVLRKHDQAAPQVALRFQIIEADGFTNRDTAIARVESVLRDLFRFRGYRLLTEAFVQAKANSTSAQTIVADGVTYRLTVHVGDVLRRDQNASAEVTTQLWGNNDPYLETSMHLPSGQAVILGTARPNPQRSALILTVTPEIH